MENRKKLKKLVNSLQLSIRKKEITRETVSDATRDLAGIGFRYDYETYPPLGNIGVVSIGGSASPQNLGEALLWKLGKWKAYRKFSRHYADEQSRPSNTDAVFYAFARHLKDRSNPIFDQHGVRAIWAICGELDSGEQRACKKFLMNKRGKWKATGGGSSGVECYRIFLKCIGQMAEGGATKGDIDVLLMPLGQALKCYSTSLSQFRQLCRHDGADQGFS